MKLLFLSILITLVGQSFCQNKQIENNQSNNFETDRDAKHAVYKIVQYSGLLPDFVIIEDNSIKNALAYTKNKKRCIKYNPSFMKRVNDSTKTDWAATSVLAHEIGHHLLGHTIVNNGSNPGDELAADRYSGFILYRMGATLEESLRCIESEGNLHGTKTHPPKEARVEAITLGWREAEKLKDKKLSLVNESNSVIKEDFQYMCKFVGDHNSYYVNKDFQMVWYDNYANPIVIGKLTESKDRSYEWIYFYDKARYGIDSGGTIWLLTSHGGVMEVGELKEM